jgi:hypothetical protein
MGQVFVALATAATALFLLCGRLPAPYNRWARNAAVAVYGITLWGCWSLSGCGCCGSNFNYTVLPGTLF